MPRMRALRQLGLPVCTWTPELRQWQARVMLIAIRLRIAEPWPDFERCRAAPRPSSTGAALDFGFFARDHCGGMTWEIGPAIPFDLCATCDRGAGFSNAFHRA